MISLCIAKSFANAGIVAFLFILLFILQTDGSCFSSIFDRLLLKARAISNLGHIGKKNYVTNVLRIVIRDI